MGDLSGRERTVLQLVADGLETSEIAVKLEVSESTVRKHLGACMRKTGQASTLQAVLAAVRRGWVHAPALAPSDDVIWCQRFDRHLAAIEQHLQRLARFPLHPTAHEYLRVLDEHLAARHTDHLTLDSTRQRMRTLIEELQAHGC